MALPRADLPIFTQRNLQNMSIGGVTALVVQHGGNKKWLEPHMRRGIHRSFKLFLFVFVWLW